MTTENRPPVDFAEKVRTFASSVGSTALLLIVVTILVWIVYALRCTGSLQGIPEWFLPSAEGIFTWVLAVKWLALVTLITWLVAHLWSRRLRGR